MSENGTENGTTADNNAAAGLTLCLSGGGFRATIFHLGALQRLNELSILPRIGTITSVSGGSILNGILATGWQQLRRGPSGVYENWEDVIAKRTRSFCQRDLRTPLLIGTRLDPTNFPVLVRDYFAVNGNFLAEAYRKGVFGGTLLSDVPAPTQGKMPRFVFCSTNIQTGACWHFHAGPNGRMGDFYTAYYDVGDITVAEAVAASSAFPPGFASSRIQNKRLTGESRVDPWGRLRPESTKRAPLIAKDSRHLLLTDGGVYDNMGVEPVWGSGCDMLISDAGRPFASTDCRQSITSRLGRAYDIAAEQVGAVRRRWLINQISDGQRKGTYWGIATPIAEYPIPSPPTYSWDVQELLCRVRTDMNSFLEGEIGCLENHGYALTDAAIRSRTPHLLPTTVPDFRWPHPSWANDAKAKVALRSSGTRNILRDIVRFVREVVER